MDEETRNRLDSIEKEISAIHGITEQTRRYFLWTLIISVVLFILPLVGLVFIIPFFLNAITSIQ